VDAWGFLGEFAVGLLAGLLVRLLPSTLYVVVTLLLALGKLPVPFGAGFWVGYVVGSLIVEVALETVRQVVRSLEGGCPQE